ncbi:MAG: bifunctional adenosylcobinamide kinase/adenosylcobinamide-phosphate guanylyltransferase [Actinomycetota bacterium]
MGKIYFLLGGARSGKSAYAEELASRLSEKVCYLATARITDEEMEKRIKLHRKRRPKSWKTIELSVEDIDRGDFSKIKAGSCPVILIDCITNLLYRLLEKYDVDKIEVIPNSLEEKIEKEVWEFFKKFIEFITGTDSEVIVVSNEVGMGVVPAYPLGRLFRDLMGMVNKEIASVSDTAYFFIAGLKQRLK